MSKVHNIQKISPSDVEQKLRSYIAAWNRNDLKLDKLFDDLYQHDFSGVHKGKKINRNELKQVHKEMLYQGNHTRLVFFRKAGACTYDMKLVFVNKGNETFTIRKLILVEDDKIANSIDYNGTLASTKTNRKGDGLSYYWHLPIYLRHRMKKIARNSEYYFP